MATKRIYIGTSGWSYKHWKGIYYPEGLKPADWLSYLASHFDVTEINTSFYHLPKEHTVTSWVNEVPAGFKFCPKISRYLTHIKRLKDPEEPLQRFFELFAPIKKHLGPVLVQLPPNLKFDYERAEHFFKVLHKDYKQYDFALEVRHDTWLANDALALLTRYNVAIVISQSGNQFPYTEMVTAKNIYVRFHGPEALYASSYSDEMLAGFAQKFRQWLADGHFIWAFFNNDINGYAIDNAKTLMGMME